MEDKQKYLIVAGEISGDLLGADLMAAIRDKSSDTWQAMGTGGPAMGKEGLEAWADVDEVTAVGVTEIFRKYGYLKKLLKEIARRAVDENCRFALLIDYPGFNIRLARKLHEAGIPVYFYVSPQVWAWKYKRVYQYRKYGRHIFCLFRFEVDIYREIGMSASYHGHPLPERIEARLEEERRENHPWSQPAGDGQNRSVALLAGSRTREVHQLFPLMLQSALFLLLEYPEENWRFRVPAAREEFAEWCRGFSGAFLARSAGNQESGKESVGSGLPVKQERALKKQADVALKDWNKFLSGKNYPRVAVLTAVKTLARSLEIQTGGTLSALETAHTVITTSGTSTLEVAWFHRPMAILYRVSPVTFAILSRWVKIPYIGMVNVLSGRFICREFIQREMTLENLAPELKRLVEPGSYRAKMIRGLKVVARELAAEKSAAAGAAGRLLEMVAAGPGDEGKNPTTGD